MPKVDKRRRLNDSHGMESVERQSQRPLGTDEENWRAEWAACLQSADDLVAWGLLTPEETPAFEKVTERYAFRLPRYYASLIDFTDEACPIRLQAIPQPGELENAPGFVPDPLSDLKHQAAPRITHRYANRVLLHLTTNCSMVCRYCFRKTLLNEQSHSFLAGRLNEGLDYIGKHPEIREVIFSGGDPLMVSDEALEQTLRELGKLVHVRRLRFHTRVPVTFPMRITEELCHVLSRSPLPTVVVNHFNHPREITSQSIRALNRLKASGVTLLNQSVLLKGVNNDSATLHTLSERLFEVGVLPYYLHHPDCASGTSHFWVSFEQGEKIYERLREGLPGYLVPRYVVDQVGTPYKRPVRERGFLQL